MPQLSRRHFLMLGATSLVALTVPGCSGGDNQTDSLAEAPSPPDPLKTRNLLLVDAAGQSEDGRGAFTVAAVGLDLTQQGQLQPLLDFLAGRRYSDLSDGAQQQFLALVQSALGFTVYFRTFTGGTRFDARTADVAGVAAQLLVGSRLDVYVGGGSQVLARVRQRLNAGRAPWRRLRSATTGRILVADAMASILSRAFKGSPAERAVLNARPDLFRAV